MTHSVQPVFIIAEAGVNHNGDLQLARQLIQAAARAGANAVKFQSFVVDELVTPDVGMADYQKRNLASQDSQYQMLSRLALSFEQQQELASYAAEQGILWLSSPFDLKSLAFLVGSMRVPLLKIPSGELTNGPLLLAAGRSQLPLVVSTGMATLTEIAQALAIIAFGLLRADEEPTPHELSRVLDDSAAWLALRAHVTLLHCTSEYPASPASINLNAMHTLREHFALPVGFSDHSQGIHIPVAATAMGAVMIEKHFTLDRQLPGPDHLASLEPDELAQMVAQIREIELALGSGHKQPTSAELNTAACARRRLVALQPIQVGERFDTSNLGVRRHHSGRSALDYWQLLGKVSEQEYLPGEGIE